MRPSATLLSDLFDSFNQGNFQGEIPKIPVEINERLTASAGRAKWTYDYRNRHHQTKSGGVELRPTRFCIPQKIELSGPLFDRFGWDYQAPGWHLSEFHKTMLHEMCHVYLAYLYDDEGHSQHFNNLMSLMTGVRGNHRYHYMLTAGLKPSPKPPTIQRGKVLGLKLSDLK